ncbi:hypothetical protein PO909_003431 [Leuciscus waleckii]
MAGFSTSRQQRELSLRPPAVQPSGHGSPALHSAVLFRPRHEPHGGQVRLAGCSPGLRQRQARGRQGDSLRES